MYEERTAKILTLIKERRIGLGYSQKQMADKLNISQNIYSKIELNYVTLTAGRFLLICEILQLNASDLLSGVK